MKSKKQLISDRLEATCTIEMLLGMIAACIAVAQDVNGADNRIAVIVTLVLAVLAIITYVTAVYYGAFRKEVRNGRPGNR